MPLKMMLLDKSFGNNDPALEAPAEHHSYHGPVGSRPRLFLEVLINPPWGIIPPSYTLGGVFITPPFFLKSVSLSYFSQPFRIIEEDQTMIRKKEALSLFITLLLLGLFSVAQAEVLKPFVLGKTPPGNMADVVEYTKAQLTDRVLPLSAATCHTRCHCHLRQPS